ncbi:MAG: transcription elongation factor GreA [Fimbriimonadaceae bacterium]|nr:transcription elongation factor GreA [Fimbriimonadaceae bacterium]
MSEDVEMMETASPFQLTGNGFQKLKDELHRLTVVKRAEIAERIRDSKDHGEFSEDNSELDEVKQQQAIVENRISELKAVLSTAEVIEESAIPVDRVGLGTVVEVEDDEREIRFSVRIVSPVESDPDNDLISDDSPMGQALWGLKPGDVAEFDAPVGLIRYKVLSLSR